ncbi:YbaB/EbfC family nucleoid-associated protein [Streptomyces tsukubensis]|uniref:Nucleoid-associated protein B1H18_32130 n=1 Tax=Streptomyces tsukubensis TaxID=83656 RepID=A0A1V3ZZC3_9ACTN|nr:YbaB/EbfC family nucleoid-associated protein [Streptomyces tsukubensis]OON71823.1 nucleoid-associated protein, YbaB/EbfC family [Streptomyces tsukubensis]QFR93691.1 YbaB/EbfC family nucleoid-associated protein [Streptomyces tsukubensis]
MTDSGQIDFAALAGQARRMEGEVAGVEQDLSKIQATGYGGDGLVTATVSGEGRIVSLRIDPSVIDPADAETLSDLVIKAVDSANQALQEQRAASVSAITDGLQGLLEGLRPRETGHPGPRTRGGGGFTAK